MGMGAGIGGGSGIVATASLWFSVFRRETERLLKLKWMVDLGKVRLGLGLGVELGLLWRRELFWFGVYCAVLFSGDVWEVDK